MHIHTKTRKVWGRCLRCPQFTAFGILGLSFQSSGIGSLGHTTWQNVYVQIPTNHEKSWEHGVVCRLHGRSSAVGTIEFHQARLHDHPLIAAMKWSYSFNTLYQLIANSEIATSQSILRRKRRPILIVVITLLMHRLPDFSW